MADGLETDGYENDNSILRYPFLKIRSYYVRACGPWLFRHHLTVLAFETFCETIHFNDDVVDDHDGMVNNKQNAPIILDGYDLA